MPVEDSRPSAVPPAPETPGGRNADEVHLHGSPVVRWLFIGAGWICVGLAALGAILPLLPTTPFLLLAAACFARGSARFYRWLLANRHFGPLIREWRETRTIPPHAKNTTRILLVVTFGISAVFFAPNWIVRGMLIVMGTVAFVCVSRLPSREEG